MDSPAPYTPLSPAQALRDDVRRKYRDALPGTAQAANWFRLEELLDLSDAEARALTARAEAAEARVAELLREHRQQVLDILRDMRLPRLPLPNTYGPGGKALQGKFDMICGQNKERAAINLYCNQKAYEYTPEGIGPDPTQAGQWDTIASAPNG